MRPASTVSQITAKMATTFPPATFRKWQYNSTRGGMEKNLKINPSAALPAPTKDQCLVQVIAIAINPVDYKPSEIPGVGRLLAPRPATPGLDFAGRLVTPATGSPLKRGQLVFGVAGTGPFAGGALAEYAITERKNTVPLPEGLDPVDAATIGVAGLTAYQSIALKVKKGDKVFINGGSGGTGVFGIQVAKAVGCYVTTSCSTANVELCKSLGADEVVDYKKGRVVDALKASGHQFDHIVDNINHDLDLYWHCHEFSKPEAEFVVVGGDPSLGGVVDALKVKALPGFLGGGKRKRVGILAEGKYDDLAQLGAWMKEGKVKAVIDQKFPFEEAPKSFEKMKTGRAKGKIVIDVASETYKNAWPEE